MFIIHKILMKVRIFIVSLYYKLIFGKRFVHGSHFSFRGSFKLYIEPEGKIQFGNNCFVNNYFSANSRKEIKIGDNCIFGENVKIYDHNHQYRDGDAKTPISQKGYRCKKVIIGNNCWIASNVTILAGVTIGDNCVIGANCLVYKDIPANSVVKHREELIYSEGRNYET